MLQLLAFYLLSPITNTSPIALSLPQAVTDAIAPAEPAPQGCVADFSGTFGIAVMNISSPAAVEKRQEIEYGFLTLVSHS